MPALEDISDIPVVDSTGGSVSFLDDVDTEVDSLFDEEPLEEQLRMARESNGWIAPRISKLPTAEQAAAGRKVRLVQFGDNGSETQIAEYTVDGLNDPVVKAVLRKYATKEGEVRSAAEHNAAMTKAMKEIARIKLTAKPIQSQAAPPTPTPPARTAMPQQPRVDVVFDFGGIDGSRRARYSDAYVEGSLLVLVADEAIVQSGVYEPPNMGPNDKFQISLSNMPQPLTAYCCGLKHSHDGKMFYLLFVDE